MKSSASNNLSRKQPIGNAPPGFVTMRMRLKNTRLQQKAHLLNKSNGFPGYGRKLIGSTRSFQSLTQFSMHPNRNEQASDGVERLQHLRVLSTMNLSPT